jgi:hypothetical protein
MKFLYLPIRRSNRVQCATVEEFYKTNFCSRNPEFTGGQEEIEFIPELEVSVYKIAPGKACRIIAEVSASADRNTPKTVTAWVIGSIPSGSKPKKTPGDVKFEYTKNHHYDIVFGNNDQLYEFAKALYSKITNESAQTILSISVIEQVQLAAHLAQTPGEEWENYYSKKELSEAWLKKIRQQLDRLNESPAFLWEPNKI